MGLIDSALDYGIHHPQTIQETLPSFLWIFTTLMKFFPRDNVKLYSQFMDKLKAFRV